MAVGLPIFIFLIGNPEKTFIELLCTEESLEGSKHKFTTSLSRQEGRWQCLRTTSCRLSVVSDSLRGLGWLIRFFKRCAVPLEDRLRPQFFAVGDSNHSGNRRGGLEQAASGQWDLVRTTPFVVDLQRLTIPAAVEPTPLSGFRSQGAQWSPRGRSDVIGRCGPLCELLLTWSYGYKCFSGDSKVHTGHLHEFQSLPAANRARCQGSRQEVLRAENCRA